MKRLAVLLVAVALLLPAAANAQLTMQMSNGWSFSFAGNVNAFWTFTKVSNSGPSNSSVRTGLLPAFATFEAKGKEAGMNLGVHFGFAPQIQNAGTHDQFGAQIDMRQVYLTVGGQWGQILAGRELALFGRQAILNDMTLFGVGAVGIGAVGTGAQGGGTTLGRIGYGYLYPNFNTASSVGGTAGIRGDFSDLTVVVSGYIGKGLGHVLQFSGQEVAPSGTDLRKSDGGYAQVMYTVNKKTNLGVSYGFSRLKNASAGETAASLGNNTVRTQWTMATAGIYHQWTKSLKLVFEGSRDQEGIGAGKPAQVDISGGFMLFF